MAKQADAVMILDEWKAAREKEQELIARINREAGPRDEIRLARLEEEKRQKEEAEAELAYRRKEMRKALRKDRREMEKMEKIFRKDMRERNGVHVSVLPVGDPLDSFTDQRAEELIPLGLRGPSAPLCAPRCQTVGCEEAGCEDGVRVRWDGIAD